METYRPITVPQEILNQLKERAQQLQDQFNAAPDAEKHEALIQWSQALHELTDAVLRGKVPKSGTGE